MTSGQDSRRSTSVRPSLSTGRRRLSLSTARLDDLHTIRDFVRRTARDLGADDDRSADLVQAVDESTTNVILHGYGGAPGPLDIALERRDGSIAVVVRDEAPPFDPTAWPEPDLGRALGERAPGGLGIHLARASVDRIEHEAVRPQGNQLTIVRHIDPGSGGAA